MRRSIALGTKTRSTLYFRMKKLGISRSVDSCPNPQSKPGAIHNSTGHQMVPFM